jgi:hypothetical protein
VTEENTAPRGYLQNSQKMSLSDCHSHLKAPSSSAAFNNGVVDSYEVTLSGDSQTDKEQLTDIANRAVELRSSVVFAAINQPGAEAFMPNIDGT